MSAITWVAGAARGSKNCRCVCGSASKVRATLGTALRRADDPWARFRSSNGLARQIPSQDTSAAGRTPEFPDKPATGTVPGTGCANRRRLIRVTSHHNGVTTGLHSHERDGTELFQAVRKQPMDSQVTVHPRTTERGSRSGTSEPRRSESGGAALLHPQELESLLLNIDASLRVRSRHQLFGWTEGVLAHGTYDALGKPVSLFVLATMPGDFDREQAFPLELIAPFLHLAWMRSQLSGPLEESGTTAQSVDPLTAREKEILRWIHLGKSNFEIGTILGISPLT